MTVAFDKLIDLQKDKGLSLKLVFEIQSIIKTKFGKYSTLDIKIMSILANKISIVV
jgi:hypothetical protein